jgi:hypothetical protein
MKAPFVAPKGTPLRKVNDIRSRKFQWRKITGLKGLFRRGD